MSKPVMNAIKTRLKNNDYFMFQYTHLVRKYSLRSNPILPDAGKIEFWGCFYDVLFLILQLTLVLSLLATMVLFNDVFKFSRDKQ